MADELKIDFGDGVSALDRVQRAVVLMLDNAIAELEALGFERDHDHITVSFDEEEMPSIEVRGRRMFAVRTVTEGSTVSVQGYWVETPQRRSWLGKWYVGRYRA